MEIGLYNSAIYCFLTYENKNDPSATKLGLSAASGSMKLYDNAVSPAKREFKEQRIAGRLGRVAKVKILLAYLHLTKR